MPHEAVCLCVHKPSARLGIKKYCRSSQQGSVGRRLAIRISAHPSSPQLSMLLPPPLAVINLLIATFPSHLASLKCCYLSEGTASGRRRHQDDLRRLRCVQEELYTLLPTKKAIRRRLQLGLRRGYGFSPAPSLPLPCSSREPDANRSCTLGPREGVHTGFLPSSAHLTPVLPAFIP